MKSPSVFLVGLLRLRGLPVGIILNVIAASAGFAQSLPSPWLTQDVGAVGATGSATYASGTFTVAGAGTGIWFTADEFRFVHQQITGDGTITARVTSIQDVVGETYEHAGIMIRESLAANSKYFGAYLTPTNGILCESRTTTGGSAAAVVPAVTGLTPPYWLRLERLGNTFTASRSSDGLTWTTIGSQSITMGTTVYVGLAVCSEAHATTCTATFTSVSVANVPSPWQTRDIGGVGAAGSAIYNGGTFTVSGSGTGIRSTADEFRFVHQSMAGGDYAVIARVTAVPNAAGGLEHAGVIIRESLAVGSTYAGVFVSPENGTNAILFEARTATNATATIVAQATSGIAIPHWVKIARGAGNTFTAYRSTDGSTWTLLGTQVVPMTAWAYAGLGVTSEVDATLVAATFTNVSAPTGEFTPPTVSITAPPDSSTVSGTVTVTANASDASGVAGVQFKLDGVILGSEDTTSPYSVSWNTTSASNAQHVLTAVARDTAGNARASAGSFVTVNNLNGYKAVFPKIGGVFYGSGNYTNTGYRDQIAKHDIGVLNFSVSTFGGAPAIQATVDYLKTQNPALRLGSYTIPMETADDAHESAATVDIRAYLSSHTGPSNGGTWTPNDWWARTASPAGGHVSSYSNTWSTNITRFVVPDANGDRYSQWYAKYMVQKIFSLVTGFDFVFSDVAIYQPAVDADWNWSGTNKLKTDPVFAAHYRTGMADYWQQLNTSVPNLMIMGNVNGKGSQNLGYLREPEYAQKMKMALFECPIGVTWSEERVLGANGGWYGMMAGYQTLFIHTIAPHFVMFDVACTADGKALDASIQSSYGLGAPYALVRYGMASALMHDGYFACHATNYSANPAMWLDEYDLAGTATTSWLGVAIDPPQTTAYQNGIFRRRFQNGMAIVNPRTNLDGTTRTAQSITPETGYRRFVGNQDPITNNGNTVTSITIQAGDGIILKK